MYVSSTSSAMRKREPGYSIRRVSTFIPGRCEQCDGGELGEQHYEAW